MKDRRAVCKYYSYENGPCDKRGMDVEHKVDCQKCKLYDSRSGISAKFEKTKREKLERAEKRDKDNY